MTIIRIFLAAVVAFIFIVIVSFIYLKWWQAMLVCTTVLLLMMLAVRVAVQLFVRKIGRSVGNVFEERGALLRGAAVEVHSVERAETPASQKQIDDFREQREREEPDYTPPEGPRAYYRIDVTIRAMPPVPPQSGDAVDRAAVAAASNWHPHELVLVPFDDAVAPEEPDPGVPSMITMMKQFTSGYRPEEIVEPGVTKTTDESEEDEGDDDAPNDSTADEVIEGPRTRRFSFLVGVPPSVRELKFKYYGESFGRIVLPQSG